MEKILSSFLFGSLIVVGSVTSAKAVTVNLHSSNVGIGSINVSVAGTTITIEENWTTLGNGFLEFSGLQEGVDYTINKIVTNNTGIDWSSLANELLDPLGQNDAIDVLPYPSFVPTGFSTSNDQDGLSFAQGSGLPRTSTVFSSLIVDEATDVRDFLDFFGGTLANGATDTITFGLRDNDVLSNEPFLLSQRPNQFSNNDGEKIPEPTSILSILAVGILSLGSRMQRKLT